ncbi:MAG: cell division protein [Rhodospirillaceae bacterium]|nr:cell division protein [Rhodospirillaceae bacterium]
MFDRRSELSLKGDGSSRFVPWVIALKVYFAALAIAGGLGLQAAASGWDAGARAAVTLPAAEPVGEGEAAEPPQVDAVLDVLNATQGIRSVRVVPKEEIADLLEPWLGEGNVVDGLPLPVLIDVEPDEARWVDWVGLEAQLKVADPRAELLTGKMWLGRLVDLARTIQGIAVVVVVLVILATAATVTLVTRAGLDSRADLVELLHLIGARDRYIARQFQWHAMLLGFRGGLLGIAFAAMTVAVFWLLSGPMESILLPRVRFDWTLAAAFVALPVVTALIAMATARRTVMRALARLP